MLAAGLLSASDAAPVAIVGSETGSALFRAAGPGIDDEQLVNAMQMGDGAGAVVLGKDDGSRVGVLHTLYFGSLGAGRSPGFWLEGGGSGDAVATAPTPGFRHDFVGVAADGPELFRRGLETVLAAGVPRPTIDWVLPHQASGRLGPYLATALGFPVDRVWIDADRIGNLGSASIWVSLDRARRSGRLRHGDSVLVLGAEATKYLFGGFVYVHADPRAACD